MTARKLIAPCIHMNGTSKESLLESLEEAFTAIDGAFDKLRQCVPNGRDYYVYGDATVFKQAQDEHHWRMKRLTDVKKELEALAIAIQDNEKHATLEA